MPDAHSIALNYYNIGHTWYQDKNLSEAAAAFESAVRVCEEAIRRGNAGRVIRLDLAQALVYICRVRLGTGLYADAVEPAQRAIATYRALLDQVPSDYSCSTLLYLAHEELGFAYQGLNRWDDVITCREAARATLKAAAERNRSVVSRTAAIQGSLARADFNLANAYGVDPARNYDKLRATYAEAYDICDKLELVEPLSDDLKTVLAFALYQKADFRIEDDILPDPSLLERAERVCQELCARQPWDASHRILLATIRVELADELQSIGRVAEARSCRERCAAATRGDGATLFEAAVVAAANARLTGTYPTRLDAQRLEQRRKMFVHRAVGSMQQAINEGFRDPARLRRSSELTTLNDDPEFRALVSSLDDRVFPAEPFAAWP